MSEAVLILTAVPDEGKGREMARALVEARLAACVKTAAACASIYRWEGRIVEDREWVLTVVTRRSLYARVEAAIKAIHPYEVPEIISLPILDGSPEYLKWIEDQTG